MSSGQRERRQRLEQAQAEQRRAERRRRLVIIGGVALVVLVVAGMATAYALEGSGSNDQSGAGATTTTRPVTPSDFGTTPCPNPDGSSPRTTHFHSAPKLCIDRTGTFTAQFQTSEGSFSVTLDSAAAPVTVNNFVVLALYHYYDGTTFHRVIPGYIVQGGDANGHPPGTGDPGYTIADEFPSSVSDFQVGSIAMANTGQPHSGGSQFFIWLGPNQLPSPAYSLFGTVTSGLAVVKKIEALGSPSGTPTTTVTLQKVTVGEAQITSR
jgi:cyclophilin family peptidyl-prolyl cis-trans isomerase